MASKPHPLLLQCLVLLLYSLIDVCRGDYILREQGQEIDTGPIYLVSPDNLKNWVGAKARPVPIEVTDVWNPCDPAAYSPALIRDYLEIYNVTSQDQWIAFASPNTLRQDCVHFNIPSSKIDVAEIWVLQLQKVGASALIIPMSLGEVHPIQPFLQYEGLDKVHGLLNEKIKIQIPTLIVTKDEYLHIWEVVHHESNNLQSTALSIEIDRLNYNPLEPISQNSGSWRIISMLILASNLLGFGYGGLVLYSEREARKRALKAKLTMATSDSIEAKAARNRRGSGLLLLGLTVQTVAFFIRGIVALDTLGCFGVLGFSMARVVFTLTIPMNTVTNTIAIFAWVDIARNALSSNKLPDLPVHDAVKKPFLRILVVSFLLSFVVVDVAVSVLVVSGAQQYANAIVAAIHVVNLIAITALGLVVSYRMRVIVEPLLTAEANKQFQERLNLAKNVDSSAIPSTMILDKEGRSPSKTSRSPSSASVVITPAKTTAGGIGKNAIRKNSDLKSTNTTQRGSEMRSSNPLRTSKVSPEDGEDGIKTPLKKFNSNLPAIAKPSKEASDQPTESIQSTTGAADTSLNGNKDAESSAFVDRLPESSDAMTAAERVAIEADGDDSIQHAKEPRDSDGREVAATSPSDGHLITKRKKAESQSYVQPPTPRRNKRKGTQGKQMRMSTTALAADEKEASKEGKSVRQPGVGLRASVGSVDSEAAPGRNLRGSVNIDLEGQGPSHMRNGRGSAAVQDLPVDEDTNDAGDALSRLMKGGSKIELTEEKKPHAPHHRINKATMQKKTAQKRELQNQIRNRKVLATMKKTARYILWNARVNFILVIMGLLVSLRVYTYSSVAFIIVQGVPQVCLVLCALIQIKVTKLSRQADVLIFDED
jgi:hypothetical protein